ncbi:MAG: hypothetical protein NVS4B2_04510 [Chloroflexota bacterium]
MVKGQVGVAADLALRAEWKGVPIGNHTTPLAHRASRHADWGTLVLQSGNLTVVQVLSPKDYLVFLLFPVER